MNKSFLYAFCVLLSSGAMWSSCSSDDSESEQTTTKMEAGKTYHMTVNATKEGDTRALSLSPSGSNIVATWSTTENIDVQYNGSSLGTLHPHPNDDASKAYLSGTVTPKVDIDALPVEMTLQFPRKDMNYTGQDGTLEKISTHYDYATATANFNLVDGILTPPETTPVTFKSQQAIVKFILKDASLQDESINALDVSELRVSATNLKTSGSTTGDITITPSSPTSELYAALRDIDGTEVTLTARVNNTYYVYRKDNVTFANGTYRPITVKMSPLNNGISLANINPGYIGWVVGDDGNVYAKPADVPSGYKAVAMVANVYKDDNNVVHRLAIALEDESGGQMTQSAASTAASGHSSITIGERTITWRLPTLADWKKMFIGCGNGASIEATEVNYTCFNAKLATVGTALKNDYYWSSIGTNYLFFNGTKVKMDNYDVEGLAHYARACFEF
ncbi:MAG: hypothetical protein IJR02_06410 [Bacteroidaceae bacterium]|nr:hypothetical protein [Bacteroidaceae bacterium]MBQ6750387.1 hypothetical protein [Bacteroidaceae bacterium]